MEVDFTEISRENITENIRNKILVCPEIKEFEIHLRYFELEYENSSNSRIIKINEEISVIVLKSSKDILTINVIVFIMIAIEDHDILVFDC